jgi:hypothetical protein
VVVVGDDTGRDRVGALQLAEVAGVFSRDQVDGSQDVDGAVGDVADVADRDGDEMERPRPGTLAGRWLVQSALPYDSGATASDAIVASSAMSASGSWGRNAGGAE